MVASCRSRPRRSPAPCGHDTALATVPGIMAAAARADEYGDRARVVDALHGKHAKRKVTVMRLVPVADQRQPGKRGRAASASAQLPARPASTAQAPRTASRRSRRSALALAAAGGLQERVQAEVGGPDEGDRAADVNRRNRHRAASRRDHRVAGTSGGKRRAKHGPGRCSRYSVTTGAPVPGTPATMQSPLTAARPSSTGTWAMILVPVLRLSIRTGVTGPLTGTSPSSMAYGPTAVVRFPADYRGSPRAPG